MKTNRLPMRKKLFKQMLHTLCICLVGGSLFACDSNNDDPKPTSPDKTTVIGLILGDNSLSHFAKNDIDEMCMGLEEVNLDKNNLILYVDDRTSNPPSIISFKQSTTDHSKVVTDTIYKYSESQGSADPDVLKDALNRIITTYPAESYAMILWSHGQGWLPTAATVVEEYTKTKYFGQDQNGDGQDWMNISDIQNILEYGKGLLGSNKKFDYLYFDACFMANIETAYQLRHISNYYIGCVAETPGPGGNYDTLVPIMFNASNNRAERLAEAYDLAYNGSGAHPQGWSYGAQISVFDNSKMSAFAAACKTVFSNQAQAQSIQATNFDATGIQHFDRIGNPAYYDFKQILSDALTSTEYSPLGNALEAMVVYNARPSSIYSASNEDKGVFSMEVNCGLAAYFPQHTSDATVSRYNNYFATYDWAEDTQITGWYPLMNYQ